MSTQRTETKKVSSRPTAVKLAGAPVYRFGHASMGLLGVALMSDGTVKVFARRRDVSGGPTKYLYTSTPYKPTGAFEVEFTMRLNTDTDYPNREGLFTVEPLCWPDPYEIDRVHMLGMPEPFASFDSQNVEIEYGDSYLRGTNRPGDKQPNRAFLCRFRFDPNAKAPLDRAVVTITDVDSMVNTTDENGNRVRRPSCCDVIHVPALDTLDDTGQVTKPGGIIIAVRVNEANYSDRCAQLTFGGGFMVDITTYNGVDFAKRASVTLNTTEEPTEKQ
jgi:hypothetical protein